MRHTCTVCGKKGEWSDTWSWYGSILLMESQPEDIPKACSDKCAGTMQQNIKSGKWSVPVLKSYGPNNVTAISQRQGY